MSKSRTFLATITALLIATATAYAQAPRRMPPPGPHRPSAAGFAPKAPTLTRAGVEKLIIVIPELAKESSKLKGKGAGMGPMGPFGGGGPQQAPPIEDIERVEKMLNKHGLTFPEFFMQLTTLLSTYLALKPDELDKQMPNENTPEIKALLDDPNIPEKQKQAIRQQLKATQVNKEAIRTKLMQLVTDENKKVVRPLLAQVERALKIAEEEARKTRNLAPKRPVPKPSPKK